MFKMLNPRRFYHAVGKKKFLEFILLAVFILFFYGPLLNMLMLAFANEYNVPSVLPQEWGFKWWGYVFGQKSLVSSMIQSFIIAIATTVISMIFCIPAAYSLARFQYPGKRRIKREVMKNENTSVTCGRPEDYAEVFCQHGAGG